MHTIFRVFRKFQSNHFYLKQNDKVKNEIFFFRKQQQPLKAAQQQQLKNQRQQRLRAAQQQQHANQQQHQLRLKNASVTATAMKLSFSKTTLFGIHHESTNAISI